MKLKQQRSKSRRAAQQRLLHQLHEDPIADVADTTMTLLERDITRLTACVGQHGMHADNAAQSIDLSSRYLAGERPVTFEESI